MLFLSLLGGEVTWRGEVHSQNPRDHERAVVDAPQLMSPGAISVSFPEGRAHSSLPAAEMLSISPETKMTSQGPTSRHLPPSFRGARGSVSDTLSGGHVHSAVVGPQAQGGWALPV